MMEINPLNECRVIALVRAQACQYLFKHAILAHAKLYMTH